MQQEKLGALNQEQEKQNTKGKMQQEKLGALNQEQEKQNIKGVLSIDENV